MLITIIFFSLCFLIGVFMGVKIKILFNKFYNKKKQNWLKKKENE
jgi:hypothetical protein